MTTRTINDVARAYEQEASECREAMHQSGNERNHARLRCIAADYQHVANLLSNAIIDQELHTLIGYLRRHLNRSEHYQFAEDRNSLLEGMANEIERALPEGYQDYHEGPEWL